jgi:hypothetical protein
MSSQIGRCLRTLTNTSVTWWLSSRESTLKELLKTCRESSQGGEAYISPCHHTADGNGAVPAPASPRTHHTLLLAVCPGCSCVCQVTGCTDSLQRKIRWTLISPWVLSSQVGFTIISCSLALSNSCVYLFLREVRSRKVTLEWQLKPVTANDWR